MCVLSLFRGPDTQEPTACSRLSCNPPCFPTGYTGVFSNILKDPKSCKLRLGADNVRWTILIVFVIEVALQHVKYTQICVRYKFCLIKEGVFCFFEMRSVTGSTHLISRKLADSRPAWPGQTALICIGSYRRELESLSLSLDVL